MDIEIMTREEYGNDPKVRLVVGSERNRKTFSPECPMSIKGLDIEAPPMISDTATVATSRSEPQIVDQPEKEDEESAWTKAFQKYKSPL